MCSVVVGRLVVLGNNPLPSMDLHPFSDAERLDAWCRAKSQLGGIFVAIKSVGV
jgi:hypothetical protein